MTLEYQVSLRDAYVIDLDGLCKLWRFMETKAETLELKFDAQTVFGVSGTPGMS